MIVLPIRANSGWSWDDELGANIPDGDPGDRWKDYEAAHPKAKPFRNKGWPFISYFDIICGDIQATGSHVFNASSQSASTAPNGFSDEGGVGSPGPTDGQDKDRMEIDEEDEEYDDREGGGGEKNDKVDSSKVQTFLLLFEIIILTIH